jgi:hypothetical protein
MTCVIVVVDVVVEVVMVADVVATTFTGVVVTGLAFKSSGVDSELVAGSSTGVSSVGKNI